MCRSNVSRLRWTALQIKVLWHSTIRCHLCTLVINYTRCFNTNSVIICARWPGLESNSQLCTSCLSHHCSAMTITRKRNYKVVTWYFKVIQSYCISISLMDQMGNVNSVACSDKQTENYQPLQSLNTVKPFTWFFWSLSGMSGCYKKKIDN